LAIEPQPQRRDTATAAAATTNPTDTSGFNFGEISSALYSHPLQSLNPHTNLYSTNLTFPPFSFLVQTSP
jgi:hypothetical protein